MLADSKITITALDSVVCQHQDTSALQNLGLGESDIIQLYTAGCGDFVVTDDGAAAKYCTRQNIRFINALLIPMLLKCTGKRSDAYCLRKFDEIVNIGRYSQWVVEYAAQCGEEELAFFCSEAR